MAHRSLAVAAAAALAASAITGCGAPASNGVAAKPADQILQAAAEAARDARSVHVSGAMTSNGQPVKLNLNLVNGKGAQGTVSTPQFSVEVIDVADTVYLKGSQSMWQRLAGKGAAQLFRGKWLKAPSTGSFAGFSQFTDMSGLFARLLSAPGRPTKGRTRTIDGRQVVAVTLSPRGGKVYVATTGKPYPVALTDPSADGGRVDFTDYNQSFNVTAPTDAVDISKFKP
jgi:hypothetical protein